MTEHEPAPERTQWLRRSQELLWRTREQPTRGPKPTLTLDQIVDTAISIADVDGIEGLTMRRLARELDVGTMSLYRYVPGKDELLTLMLDQVCGLQPEAAAVADEDWRPLLEAAARGTWRLYLDHPWLMLINWSRPVFGPNSLANVELFMEGLDGLGLSSQERVMMMMAVDSLVVGLARSQVLFTSAPEETGISHEEFWALQIPVLEEVMASGDYPAMAALDEDAFDASWETTFEFCLSRLLDGLESLIDGRNQS